MREEGGSKKIDKQGENGEYLHINPADTPNSVFSQT